MQATTRWEIPASFALAPERIQFAENFLGDEFERSPDRLVLAEMMGELREVTFQPGQFLGNIGAIGEEGDLLEQAFVIELAIGGRPFRFVRARPRGIS